MARDDAARELTKSDRLDRRSYLRLAGTAAASFAAVGTANAAEYETITVPAGETRTISVGDGETFENVLIDMTAQGASAKILTSGSGWTIRNVGFAGTHPGGHYIMTPGVSDPEGEGLVENIYLGDGQVARSGGGGVWVNANLPHRGTITFRNVHIAGMIDNGLYGSGPGAQGYGGNLNVESSYFAGNTISNIRLNAKERVCRVVDTVVDARGAKPCGTNCSAPGATTTRAIWSWYGETRLENCDIVGSIATVDGGSVTRSNTRVGDGADLTPPESVPMSAEEAASGRTDGRKPNGDRKRKRRRKRTAPTNVVSVTSADASAPTEYELTVTGTVEKSTDRGATTDEEDGVDGGTATGAVAGGTDSYRFSGTLDSMKIDGDATVIVSGEEVDEEQSRTLVVDGTAAPGTGRYSFETSGDVSKNTELGTVNVFDGVSEGGVTGRVIDRRDCYRFTGHLRRLDVNGRASIDFKTTDD